MTVSPPSPSRPPEQVAVLGLGTMGHGIAQAFALAGHAVRCYDDGDAARRTLLPRVESNLQTFVAAGLLAPEQLPAVMARFSVHESAADAVTGCQFVTEAIFENLPLKQRFLEDLEPHLEADAIVASNSSSFPISQAAARMQRRHRAIVAHWFNPPHLVPLVEVVPGPETSEAVTAATMRHLQRIGKRPIRLRKELPGFLVNRIQVAIMREVWDLVDRDVASPEEIDAAVRDSIGFRLSCLGPLEIHDFGGLDIQSIVFDTLVPEIRGGTQAPDCIRRLVGEGNLGAKSGRGFHDYSPERLATRVTRRDRLFLEQWKSRLAEDA